MGVVASAYKIRTQLAEAFTGKKRVHAEVQETVAPVPADPATPFYSPVPAPAISPLAPAPAAVVDENCAKRRRHSWTLSQCSEQAQDDQLKVTFHEDEVTFELHQGHTQDEQHSASAFQAVLDENPTCGQLQVSLQHTASSCKLLIKADKDTAFMLPLFADLAEATERNEPLVFQPPGSIWAFAICVFLLDEDSGFMCEDWLGNEALHPSLAGQCLEVAEFFQAEDLQQQILAWLPSCFRLYQTNTEHDSKLLHLTKMVTSVQDRFLAPIVEKVSFSTAARSHPLALTKWLQASPPTLHVTAEHLIGLPARSSEATATAEGFGYRIAVQNRNERRTWHVAQRGVQLVSPEQWVRVLQCMKDAPHITELHVWGGSLHRKKSQSSGGDVLEEDLLRMWPNAGFDECNNFFKGLARGHNNLESLPFQKLVIDDMLLVPSRGSIGFLPVIESAFGTLSRACRLTDLHMRDMWLHYVSDDNYTRLSRGTCTTESEIEVIKEAPHRLTKAIAGVTSLQRLMVPLKVWLGMVGDGPNRMDALAEGCPGLRIRNETNGELLGMAEEGKIASVHWPVLERSCHGCGNPCTCHMLDCTAGMFVEAWEYQFYAHDDVHDEGYYSDY